MSDGSKKTPPVEAPEDFFPGPEQSDQGEEPKKPSPESLEKAPESRPEHFKASPCPPNHIYVLDPNLFFRKTKPVLGVKLSEAQTRLRDLLQQHRHLARAYPLRGYPKDMGRRWQALRKSFPNFGEVLDLLEKRHALAMLRKGSPVSFTPLLLLGDPGVGKTAFCTALAKELGLFYGEIPLAGLTEAFTISGLDLGWSTGNPGRVFEFLSAAGHANPLMALDELDKVGGKIGGGEPTAPLHMLLEKHSAARFEDVAIRMPVDMSWINWIATANDPAVIPVSLISRFRKFVIQKPSRDEMQAVMQSVYQSRRESVINGDLFAVDLDKSIMLLLQDLTPREIGLILEEAMGNAARRPRGRRRIRILADDIALPKSEGKRSIGFCPSNN